MGGPGWAKVLNNCSLTVRQCPEGGAWAARESMRLVAPGHLLRATSPQLFLQVPAGYCTGPTLGPLLCPHSTSACSPLSTHTSDNLRLIMALLCLDYCSHFPFLSGSQSWEKASVFPPPFACLLASTSPSCSTRQPPQGSCMGCPFCPECCSLHSHIQPALPCPSPEHCPPSAGPAMTYLPYL